MESKVIEDLKNALENLDLVSAVSIINIKYLEDTNKIPLNIAITGESGVGKSAFVNAFRGIDNADERAAPTGVETTKPESYPHPIYPNVTLWDLPGVGTSKFPADQYLKHSWFENVDFFIIVSAGRFRENDARLAQEIKKMDKNFYFVRSKIDNNLSDAKRSQREYDEEKTLQKIRENCIQGWLFSVSELFNNIVWNVLDHFVLHTFQNHLSLKMIVIQIFPHVFISRKRTVEELMQ